MGETKKVFIEKWSLFWGYFIPLYQQRVIKFHFINKGLSKSGLYFQGYHYSEVVFITGLTVLILSVSIHINVFPYVCICSCQLLLLCTVYINVPCIPLSRFRTVHYLREIVCKRPDSSVSRAEVRYSAGPGFNSQSGCTFFSPCDTMMWIYIHNTVSLILTTFKW
jgi:hypothetical protein